MTSSILRVSGLIRLRCRWVSLLKLSAFLWLGSYVSLACAAGQADGRASSDSAIFSIDKLVALVVANNPALEAGRRSVDIATAGITTASAYPNPKLEFDAGRSAATGLSSSGQLSSVGVSQLIENPALRSARVNSALFAEQSSQQTLRQTRNELVAQVRLRAYEYLLRREEAQAASDALSLLEQIRERVKLRVETGETGKYELIKSDAEIVNARQREQTARLQIAQAAISLNRLAGGRLPAEWTLDAQLADIVEVPDLQALKARALRDNPEILWLGSELERNQSRITEANASRWPGVELRLRQSREPALISVMFANNETGVLQPIAEVVRLAGKAGALVHCDAVQGAGKVPLELHGLGVDYLSLSAHKLGGPAGMGALVVRSGTPLVADRLGGGQELNRRAGTENVAGIAGFGAAAGAARTGLDVAELRDRLERALLAIAPAASVFGGVVPRLPNTSCVSMPGVKADTQVMALDLAGVCVSAGAACSSGKVTRSPVLLAMQVEAAVADTALRISLGWNSPAGDIERLIDAWRDLYIRVNNSDMSRARAA